MNTKEKKSATVESCALGRLEELREELAMWVKSIAAAFAVRENRSEMTPADIEHAWKGVVADKSLGCDISAERLALHTGRFAGKAIQRICDLKWALHNIVLAEAMERVEARGGERMTVMPKDIDEAWNAMTFGYRPELMPDQIQSSANRTQSA